MHRICAGSLYVSTQIPSVSVSAIVFSFYECTKGLLPAASFRNRGVVALPGSAPVSENRKNSFVSTMAILKSVTNMADVFFCVSC